MKIIRILLLPITLPLALLVGLFGAVFLTIPAAFIGLKRAERGERVVPLRSYEEIMAEKEMSEREAKAAQDDLFKNCP